MTALTTRRPSAALRMLVIRVVAATLAAGVWVAGGVISNDFRLSVALTTVWFGVCGVACLTVALRLPAFRLPVLATYVVVAGAIGGYLGLTTLRDRVVDETLVTGVPRQADPASEAPAAAQRRNVELLSGRFRSGEHATAGKASIIRLADGRRFLTLTSFSTSPGPDLRVRLVPGDSQNGGAAGAADLGALKGNRGNQQYRIPRNARVNGRSVVIWCRAFSAPFGSARLT
jgi:Electron transfer DM13